MIKFSNIYYMLAYAFRSLHIGGIVQSGSEEFDNLHELFAEIIINGMQKQLKRGLPRYYTNKSEELSNLRGKIDIPSSVCRLTMIRNRMICEFDEFMEDTPGNRLIKCAITHLLRQNNISANRKYFLRFFRSSLSSVTDVEYVRIPPQRTGGAEYVMLINVCRFLLDNMLMNTSGSYKMRELLTDEAMGSLYEHFLLEYFRRHHSCFNACPAQIDWDMDVIPLNMPKMKSDVYLTYGGRTLVIDAKFYTSTMSEYFGKKTFHSHNLYQIYTYVKNADKAKDGSVSGILLYAKTDEDITPDNDSIIGGNGISIKTLDLSQNFTMIKSQLDKIADILKS